MRRLLVALVLVAGLLSMLAGASVSASAAGATSELHVVKYAADRTTVLAEKTVSYQWMKDNLPVHGDGVTHYYHQGPVFEGDMWDPAETQNLKDKGAVMGTNSRDLCDLVGGMAPGDEVSFVAVDGWHTEFARENIYEPTERQGLIVLAWYNGEDSATGEKYGTGYPGLDGYYSAMQLVVMAGTTNDDGKHVFGNDDMRVALPKEKYQHFYEGLPSTNGLSGKWIGQLSIYSQGEAASKAGLAPAGSSDQKPGPVATASASQASPSRSSSSLTPALWLTLGCGAIGLVLVSLAIYRLRRERR